jgi:hypothetical protein
MTVGQRAAVVLGVVVAWILIQPLVGDVVDGRRLALSGWAFEGGFALVALSLIIGLASAVSASDDGYFDASLTGRRYCFWVGVALLPAAWLLLILGH